MRLPRDLTGAQLIRALGQLGYQPTRQSGSHVRLTCESPMQHHLTVPLHDPLRIGTLAAVLSAVADAHGISRDELQQRLLG
ncbi:MAG: putative periplasmic or secreted lipoprotein [Polaromonas sp.]|jgi:predicted RNA binding protein YcfA (HicA-like mRNA interferase family)|nr:putative periplasmic or secreted lipoprotein [Polaromonas sp.]